MSLVSIFVLCVSFPGAIFLYECVFAWLCSPFCKMIPSELMWVHSLVHLLCPFILCISFPMATSQCKCLCYCVCIAVPFFFFTLLFIQSHLGAFACASYVNIMYHFSYGHIPVRVCVYVILERSLSRFFSWGHNSVRVLSVNVYVYGCALL